MRSVTHMALSFILNYILDHICQVLHLRMVLLYPQGRVVYIEDRKPRHVEVSRMDAVNSFHGHGMIHFLLMGRSIFPSCDT